MRGMRWSEAVSNALGGGTIIVEVRKSPTMLMRVKAHVVHESWHAPDRDTIYLRIDGFSLRDAEHVVCLPALPPEYVA